jgi:hypothetical protein
MKEAIARKIRWFIELWSEASDESTRVYRSHVRGLFVGWAATAIAMGLLELFPNGGNLSMYDLLRAQGLPWQQHWLAAVELSGPMLMAWHVNGLRRWGKKRLA